MKEQDAEESQKWELFKIRYFWKKLIINWVIFVLILAYFLNWNSRLIILINYLFSTFNTFSSISFSPN